jgi:hypothetical protein
VSCLVQALVSCKRGGTPESSLQITTLPQIQLENKN